MKKYLNFTNFLIVLSIAIMTVFLIVIVNQELINSRNEREFNNFYGGNSRRISIDSDARKFSFDVTGLSENYVIYGLLSNSSEKNYLADSVRTVYGEGNFPIPTIKAGRFFTAEELLSEEALCVVGQTTFNRSAYTKDEAAPTEAVATDSETEYIEDEEIEEKVFDETKEYYYLHSGIEYKIIGVFGMNKTSDIDTITMLNFGGYIASKGSSYKLTYHIDSFNTEEIDTVFTALGERVVEAEGEWREILYSSPLKSIDVYYTYIYLLGCIILILNLLIVSFRYAAKNEYRMCIKKMLGVTSFRLAAETCGSFACISFIGMGIGIWIFSMLSKTQFFESSGLDYFAGLTWQTILFTAVIVYAVSLSISVFPLIRIYKLDTSAQIRG